MLYRFLRVIIVFIVKVFIRPKIIGKENIPSNGKIILAGTHTSILDCLVIISCTKRDVHFLAKKELIDGPFKLLFKNMGIIPVDRSIKDKSVIPKAEEYLSRDEVIAIFPEGTTEKGRGLLPFKIGTVKIAYDTNTKIIPFVKTGKYFINSKIIFDSCYIVGNNDLDKENKLFYEHIEKMLKEG